MLPYFFSDNCRGNFPDKFIFIASRRFEIGNALLIPDRSECKCCTHPYTPVRIFQRITKTIRRRGISNQGESGYRVSSHVRVLIP